MVAFFFSFCNISLPFQAGIYVNLVKRPAIYQFFIYLFLAVLGLCCCTQAFSSGGKRGLLFVVVRGLLVVVASLVAEHGL